MGLTVACLYILMTCGTTAIPESAPALVHTDGFWTLYVTKNGVEQAQTYADVDDCRLDSAMLRDLTATEASVCYDML